MFLQLACADRIVTSRHDATLRQSSSAITVADDDSKVSLVAIKISTGFHELMSRSCFYLYAKSGVVAEPLLGTSMTSFPSMGLSRGESFSARSPSPV